MSQLSRVAGVQIQCVIARQMRVIADDVGGRFTLMGTLVGAVRDGDVTTHVLLEIM